MNNLQDFVDLYAEPDETLKADGFDDASDSGASADADGWKPFELQMQQSIRALP